MYYFAYEIKDGKAEINREIDPIKYMKDHKADYEDEKCRSGKRLTYAFFKTFNQLQNK